MKPSVVVLASGSGTLLQALLDDPVGKYVVAVGSDLSDAPALERARRHQIPTFVCDPRDFTDRDAWNEQLLCELAEFSPDLIVSAGFMRIIGPRVLDEFPQRIINTHPAYLPEFPGAHAVRDALAAGATRTGCSVHIVDEGVDTGPVLAQERIDVLPDDDEVRLHERIKVVERRLLISTVASMIEGIRKDGARE
jgi:phosphoribosylglycinamide formyltransferase 1